MGFVVIWGVFALVMDFREVMLTSPPELDYAVVAHTNEEYTFYFTQLA